MGKINRTQALITTLCLNLIALVIFFGPIWSCADFTDEYHYYVAPELKSFVDNFYREAKKRGFELPTNGLSVRIHSTDSEKYEGESLNGSFIVNMKPDFVYSRLGARSRVDSLDVECVVFHELGHGLLYENHRGGVSIMNANGDHNYQYSTDEAVRQCMIDELFSHCGIYLGLKK